MKAVLCPVCEGEGQVCIGVSIGSTSAAPMLKTCYGCGGKGWVVIPEVIITVLPTPTQSETHTP